MKAQFPGSRILFLASLTFGLAGCGGGGSSSSFDVPTSVVITDLNGDGAPDIAVATASVRDNGSSNDGFASLFLQNASSPGTFQSATRIGADNSPAGIAFGDLTGTGTTDLVVANFDAGTVSVFLQTGPGSGQYQSAMNDSTGGRPNDVVIADVNGDGKQDIIVADSASSGRVVILPQDPANPAHFLAPVGLATTNAAASVVVGDVNGDGFPDIVTATADDSGNNGAIVVFYQDPTNAGSFPTPVTFAAGAQPGSVKIADLNGDTLPDLAVANIGPGTDGIGSAGVTVLVQDSANPGTFLAPVTYAAQSGTIHLVVADVDGDGKSDIVTANLGPSPSGSVSILLQDATRPGVFLAPVSYSGFGQPLSVAVGDLNNDGRPDIAVADGNTATVMFQSTTPGTFSGIGQIG